MTGRLGAEFDPADPEDVRQRVDALRARRRWRNGRLERVGDYLDSLGQHGTPRPFAAEDYLTDRPVVRRPRGAR